MKKEGRRIIFETREELPLTAMSLEGTDWNKTGSWKYLEPLYRNHKPPCSNRCLTGGDIVAMMRLVEEGRWDAAVQGMLRVNPFPAVTGRVCPHPCEQPCNRKAYGGGVSIRSVERQVGDHKLEKNIRPELPKAEHPKVHVVGSGPAGLSAAVALRRLGHPVIVHEAAAEAGGLLRYGIPAYRLPVGVIRSEIQWVQGLGVEFDTGHRMDSKEMSSLGPTILAFGLGSSRQLRIPGEDLPGVHDGLKLLTAIRAGEKVDPGQRVAVIGGGNTAMDVARSLLRMGSEPTIYYRRTKREMPAFKEEILQADEEGIPTRFLTAPVKVEESPGKGLILELIEMELGEPDASGRARPIPKEGSEFTVELDAVVKALGEGLDTDILPEGVAAERGCIVTDEAWRTERPDVFACGDAAGRLGYTVGEAIRSGRLCAHALHEHLTGNPAPPFDPHAEADVDPELAKFKHLNMAYFEREEPHTPAILSADVRRRTFDAIEKSFGTDDARREAARCFKCGTCTECDTCLYFCPDLAISRRNGGGYEVDLDYCKGCGVCVEECPRHAIHLRRST